MFVTPKASAANPTMATLPSAASALADMAGLFTATSGKGRCLPMTKAAHRSGDAFPESPAAVGMLYRAASFTCQAAPSTPESREEQQLLLRDGRRTSSSSRTSSQDNPFLPEEGSSSRASSRAGHPVSPVKALHRPAGPRATTQQQQGVGAVYQRQGPHKQQQGNISMYGQTWQQAELLQEGPQPPSPYHHHHHHPQQQQHQQHHARQGPQQQPWLPQGQQVQPLMAAPLPLLSTAQPQPPAQYYQGRAAPALGHGAVMVISQQQLWELQQQQQQQLHHLQAQPHYPPLQQQAAGYFPIGVVDMQGAVVLAGGRVMAPPLPLGPGAPPAAVPPPPHMSGWSPAQPLPPAGPLPPPAAAAGAAPGGVCGAWMLQRQGGGWATGPAHSSPALAPASTMPMATAGVDGTAAGAGVMGSMPHGVGWVPPPPPSPPPTPPRQEAAVGAVGLQVAESCLPPEGDSSDNNSSSSILQPYVCTSWEELWTAATQLFKQWMPTTGESAPRLWLAPGAAAAGGDEGQLPGAAGEALPGSCLAPGRLRASLAAAGLVVGGEEPLLVDLGRAAAAGHVVCVGGAPW